MDYLEMFLRLKSIYENEIVFISCGAFYIAIAEDAVILSQELGLKVNCIRKNMCKVGVPKNSIEKYIKKLDDLEYSYIVLDVSKENKTLTSVYARKRKGYRIENIKFYLKQEEYIMWLYNELKNMTYKHGGYTVFYITEPKLRKIEKSRYIDRIVHRWLVDEFLEPTFVPTFINTSFACLKGRGMHKAALYVQAFMKKAKNKWDNYYILKMDVAKYFDSINKKILLNILERKIKDEKVMWLVKEILYSQDREKGLEIGNYTSQMFRKYLFK